MRRAYEYAKGGMPPFNSFTVMLMIVWTFIFYQALQVWWLQRIPPTTIYEESVIDPLRVMRGGSLLMQLKVVRSRSCSVLVTRYIVDSDGTRIDLPSTFMQLTKVGFENYTRQLIVPDYVSLGPAKIYIASSYSCHWSHILWPVLVTRSYDFTITE